MKREEVRNIPDWEYMDEYYKDNSQRGKELTLEAFQTESSSEPDSFDSLESQSSTDTKLNQTIKEVTAVRELMQSGKSIEETSKTLSISEERVRLVQMCLYGASEDSNDVAAAYLVLMEES